MAPSYFKTIADSSMVGLVTGFLTACADLGTGGNMHGAAAEGINTLVSGIGSSMLSYHNKDTQKQYAAGIVAANICHRITYYTAWFFFLNTK
jgi:hypothetical protein